MSNNMIIWSYRLATFAMVEGAVLLWIGMVYGFWMMLVAVIYKEYNTEGSVNQWLPCRCFQIVKIG